MFFDLRPFWESKRGPKTAPRHTQIRRRCLPEAFRTSPEAPGGRLGDQGSISGCAGADFGTLWGSFCGNVGTYVVVLDVRSIDRKSIVEASVSQVDLIFVLDFALMLCFSFIRSDAGSLA